MENTSTVTNLQFKKFPEHCLGCLKSSSLFSSLSDEDMDCFQRVAQDHSYKKGKVLYIEEEQAKFFYVIVSGWIKLFHINADGDEVIVDMLTAGHIVGEMRWMALAVQESGGLKRESRRLSFPSYAASC